mmetsp:Transcript_44523/g.79996  ORF Transcript_44523/g.79996 Transcript_44523/m.79996 type:complete len:393 (+) Transcript_44523:50-1228(+)
MAEADLVKELFDSWDELDEWETGLSHAELEKVLTNLDDRFSHDDVERLFQDMGSETDLVRWGEFVDYVWRSNPLPAEFFVINGFYMSMRDCYTKKGSSIYYFLVEWDAEQLPWAAFRAQVIGATDPAEAASGSLRAKIMEEWSSLGLSGPPNVGDNGVHASASPLEGLGERANWLGQVVEEDEVGKAMLEAGVPLEMLKAWLTNLRVEFQGKSKDVFDHLEDLDTGACIERAVSIAGGAAGGAIASNINKAFVFVKPHAATQDGAIEALVRAKFTESGISIASEGRIGYQAIDEKKLVDKHYGAIAAKASLQKPSELQLTEKAEALFSEKFGESWQDALEKGLLFNAFDTCRLGEVDGEMLNKAWEVAMAKGLIVKLGGGFKCARINVSDLE